MSIDASGELPSHPELPLGVALEEFAIVYEGFLDACKRYIEDPSAENQDLISETANTTLDPFEKATLLILDDENLDTPTKAIMTSGLMKSADEERVTRLTELLGEGVKFQDMDHEKFTRALTARLSSYELNVENITKDLRQMYAHDMEIDIRKLFNIKEVTVDTPSPINESQAQDVKRAVGKHVLDVAKIVAGVWVAIQLSRRRK